MSPSQPDPLVTLLADALRGLHEFVENRPPDATEDDDVKALEDVAFVLNKVAPEDLARLVEVLGEQQSRWVGLIE